MKPLMIILFTGLFACGRTLQDNKRIVNKQEVEFTASSLPKTGEKIQGDFDGDGKIDTATIVNSKKGQGNPVEEGTSDEYQIQFSGIRLKSINVGCCNARLINEGDLNKDGADDLSVFQSPMNGCTYLMTAYSFNNMAWQKIVKTFLIPTGCDDVPDEDLQKRIFTENGTIYYYDTELNNKSRGLIKKKAERK